MRGSGLARTALWASTWALGVGIGVALGAYLTAVSGSGAPGVESLDLSEILWMPLASAGAVFVALFLVRIVVDAIAGRLRA